MIRKICFVIPVRNEQENLAPLHTELTMVAKALPYPYRVLFIDDGSSDGSLDCLRELAAGDPQVSYLALERHAGQSAALAAGFRHADGDVVVTLDADLQNDPADIPKLLAYYGDYQLVNGWRVARCDPWSKRLGSRVGNWVRNRLTGESIRDTGCSLKVMDAALLRQVKMYRGLHRFLPTLLRSEGARVIEVPVHHRPRRHGRSNYGNLRRGFEGFFDLLVVRWMLRRQLRIEIKERHV